MKKPLIIIIAVILVLGVIAAGLVILRGDEDTWLCSNGQWVKHGHPAAPMPTSPCAGGATACTMEAKICPDGSAVGRTGPNCEFAPCPTTSAQMANPASVNCQEKGGTLEIITAADGSQSGMCKFSDGSQCEEWAFFNGTCQNGDSINTSNWKNYQDTNMGILFSFKYPSSWTYQKFSCNVDGVAFCPLTGHGPLNCGQTCGMNSPISPIYLYSYQGKPALAESDALKYWADPNISLGLSNSQYKAIYTNMISSFKFTN